MSLSKLAISTISLVFAATMAFAEDITIEQPYAIASSMMAKSGAIFMHITNNTAEEDRLIGARTDVAMKPEIHTHIMEDGIAKMREIEGGLVLPAGETSVLQRGGDHVMLMGLTGPFVHGEMFTVTLIFQNAGEITIDVMIDNERDGMNGEMMQNGNMNGGMNNGTMNNASD